MKTKKDHIEYRKSLLRLGGVDRLAQEYRATRQRELIARTEHADAARAMVEFATAHPISIDDLVLAGFSRTAAKRIIARADHWVQSNGWIGGVRPLADRADSVLAVLPHRTVKPYELARGVVIRRCAVGQRSDVLDIADRIGVYDGQQLTLSYPIVTRRTAIRGHDQEVDIYVDLRDETAKQHDGTAEEAFVYDMLVLGRPEVIDIPLGFRNRSGISKARHVLLDDLLEHGELRGVPTVKPAGADG